MTNKLLGLKSSNMFINQISSSNNNRLIDISPYVYTGDLYSVMAAESSDSDNSTKMQVSGYPKCEFFMAATSVKNDVFT